MSYREILVVPTKPKQVDSERDFDLQVRVRARYQDWLKSQKKADGGGLRLIFAELTSEEFGESPIRIAELLKGYR